MNVRLSTLRTAVRDASTKRIAMLQSFNEDDRGDVPGWVLVAVMTAGLVTGIWVVADDQLTGVLSKAIDSVSK